MRGRSGQAMIEWIAMLPLYVAWMVAAVIFGQWFLIHQQLVGATREAAWLYSSGRMEKADVRRYVQDALQKGYPPIQIPDENIVLGRAHGSQSTMFQLDEVRISYVPPKSSWLRRYFTKPLEESCVIKHAPAYWTFTLIQSGPPVPW